MGERGPAKRPATLRLLTGRAPGKDSAGREVELPPPFERDAPEPPAWLDGYGLEVWHRVLPELDRLQLVKIGDGEQFAVYCRSVAAYADAQRDATENGLVLTAESGRRYRNPAFSVMTSAAETLVRLAREFGLTPSSEANLAGLDGVPKAPSGAGGDDAGDNPYAATG